MRKYHIFSLLACLTTAAATQAAPAPPKLVVQIVVSQMRYDYLQRFGHNFAENGFNAFLRNGVTCTNARYGYMNTTTPAGLATLTTGSDPCSHGILSEHWIDYTTNGDVRLIEDDRYFGVGCVETDGQYSPAKLSVSTLGDELKKNDPRSKVVSLALHPASAIVAGGNLADAAYWFDIHRGNWSTSTYYLQRLPNWVEKYNEQRAVDAYNDRVWNISLPPSSYVCTEHSDIVPDSVRRNGSGFSLSALFRQKPDVDYAKLSVTPVGTDMLTDFAKQTVVYENLGKDEHPDLLLITVDPTRDISESYGTESMENEDAYYRLDRNLADLMEYIGVQVGKENVLFVLTSDHGASDTYREGGKMPGGLFNVMQFKVLINGFLNTQYGTATWVVDYDNRSLYLNRRIVFEKNLSLAEMQTKAAAFALQFRGVSEAVTATALQNSHFSGGALSKIQKGFYPKHSGDIVINLMPGWIEDTGDRVSTSGSLYEYEAPVPLLWYGPGLGKETIHDPVDMTDVAPTLARILGINRPDVATGREIIPLTTKYTD